MTKQVYKSPVSVVWIVPLKNALRTSMRDQLTLLKRHIFTYANEEFSTHRIWKKKNTQEFVTKGDETKGRMRLERRYFWHILIKTPCPFHKIRSKFVQYIAVREKDDRMSTFLQLGTRLFPPSPPSFFVLCRPAKTAICTCLRRKGKTFDKYSRHFPLTVKKWSLSSQNKNRLDLVQYTPFVERLLYTC